MSGLCHVAKERYCEPHGLFMWSEVQNVLQNMPLQKFCKIFYITFFKIFRQFFTQFLIFQIDLGFGHEVPIFLLMLLCIRGCGLRD